MPADVYKFFIDGVEDTIRNLLKVIHTRSDRAAIFEHKVSPACSTKIYFQLMT